MAELLGRLALLREAEEAAQRRRRMAELAQAEAQSAMLAAYRTRLAQGWQDGAVSPAGQAQRAGLFSQAAKDAQAQLAAAADVAAAKAGQSLARLLAVQAERRALARLRDEARRDEARAMERASLRGAPMTAAKPRAGKI